MVAKITWPHRMEAALYYNENKVRQGRAHCLLAANFLQDAGALNAVQKRDAFQRLHELNDRARTKTMHVSLNFDPRESLPVPTLLNIATDYMTGIGFGEQPFLVYQHMDAAHPHLHIVTTTIKEDGSRIPTHFIGKYPSEKTRKAIEKKYELVQAEGQQHKPTILPLNIEKALYGKTETRKSIFTIVHAVLNTYHFTSLPELNAVLRQFNVIADRGNEQGSMYRHRGLVYRMLDAQGQKVGVPIKASSIHPLFTLDKLEKKFRFNQGSKEKYKPRLKAILDRAVLQGPLNVQQLMEALSQKNIYTRIHQNPGGKIYGITFVDNDNKVVFNGSELGKEYSIAHLLSRMNGNNKKEKKDWEEQQAPAMTSGYRPLQPKNDREKNIEQNTSLMELLLSTYAPGESIPFPLLQKKRRSKKRKQGS